MMMVFGESQTEIAKANFGSVLREEVPFSSRNA